MIRDLKTPTATATFDEVFVTRELAERPVTPIPQRRVKEAIQELAAHMATGPEKVLPRFVSLAMEMTGGVSSGISVSEPEAKQFRWAFLQGSLSAFEGATTPRDFSPCGITLDCDMPILTRHSERYYPWIADVNVALPEVLLVPLHRGAEQLGTLWIVSDELSHFNAGHVEAVKEIAAFVSIALQMHQTEKRLSRALEEQEMLTAEMSHRIKNLLATTGALVQMSARGSATKDDMTHSLMGRLNALGFAHALVRSEFSSGHEVRAAFLHDLLNGVVSPYATPALSGPDVRLGERATNAIALIFHELTTNAAKYGALSAAGGTVSVAWTIEDDKLVLAWTESGGPAPTTTQSGFGSRMVQGTVASLEGAIEYDWKPTGLSAKVSIPTGRIAN